MEASDFAAASGWRMGTTSTLVPIRGRRVRPARNASAAIGSRYGPVGSSTNWPVVLYGYRDALPNGITT